MNLNARTCKKRLIENIKLQLIFLESFKNYGCQMMVTDVIYTAQIANFIYLSRSMPTYKFINKKTKTKFIVGSQTSFPIIFASNYLLIEFKAEHR